MRARVVLCCVQVNVGPARARVLVRACGRACLLVCVRGLYKCGMGGGVEQAAAISLTLF